MYVLVSAFKDSEKTIPVKLEIKEFSDKQNTLYVAIALEGIKIEPIAKRFAESSASLNRADIGSINSISDLFAFVKQYDAKNRRERGSRRLVFYSSGVRVAKSSRRY